MRRETRRRRAIAETFTDAPRERIPAMVDEIECRLEASGHPFIIGSECDVRSMPGYEKAIMAKVSAFTHAARTCAGRDSRR